MQIRLDTSTATYDELTGLIALCASLGGRLPDQTMVSNMVVKISADTTDVAAAIQAVREQVADDVPTPPVTESTEGNAAAGAGETSGGDAAPFPSAAIELDADGIPWDERIHASTKTKTQAGVWTKKRKVDEVEYGKIHAELQEQYAGNDDTPPPPASSTPDENAPTDDMDVPPPPAPDALADFKEFADLVTAVSKFGIPYVKLAEMAGKVTDGLVARFPDLKDKPDYWSDFYELAVQEAG